MAYLGFLYFVSLRTYVRLLAFTFLLGTTLIFKNISDLQEATAPGSLMGEKVTGWNIPPSELGDITAAPTGPRYQFSCSNIHQINIIQTLGRGVTKQALLGVYRGRKVVVKMTSLMSEDIVSCLKETSQSPEWRSRCIGFPNMKIMKEILLLQQLDHPNILDLLGFCVRSEETNSMSLLDHGVIAVYEYAQELKISAMERWTFSRRLDTATQMMDLAVYLEHSPLGSLKLPDFKTSHFRLVGETAKFIDFDDVDNLEPSCSDRNSSSKTIPTPPQCKFGLSCESGICRGFNAKINIKNMADFYLLKLLHSRHIGEEPELSTSSNLPTLLTRIGDLLISVRSDLRDFTSANSTAIHKKLLDIRNIINGN